MTVDFLRFEPPRFSKARLLDASAGIFGVTGELDPLEGERDQNHRLTCADGRVFVLKVSGSGEEPGVVDFQIEALRHLERTAPSLPVPRVVPTLGGAGAGEIAGADGSLHKVRLLSYLPGIPHSEGEELSEAGLAEVGRFSGALAKALGGFSHPSARHFTPWDMNNGLLGTKALWSHGDPDIAVFESRLRPLFENLFGERLRGARSQVAHFDLHRDNLLRADLRDEAVAGVIDFGDMVHGPLVCDAAILAASFSFESDPVDSMARVIAGYHEVFPLLDTELSTLHDLVLARLAQVMLLTDFRLKETEQPPDFIRQMRPDIMMGLERVSALDGRAVTRAFLSACGRDA